VETIHQSETASLVTQTDPPHRLLWGDVDNDGFKDIFVLDVAGNLFFRNKGDGRFQEQTRLAFPEGAQRGVTGFFGDYNTDEYLDLFLSHEDGFPLFRNEGRLLFSDVT